MINLGIPKDEQELKPRITVIGVGGAGGNAVNNMVRSNMAGCEFIATNTDAQALSLSNAPRKIQLGIGVTRGLGAGARPDVGRAAAEEAIDEILEAMQGSNMVFITAGMGGGTGTGAAPVIARVARESGILTIGVVTKPFHFEGVQRMRIAETGMEELQKYVDTLIIIPNQNLFRIANERTTLADAFKMADDVLHAGVRGVTDLMVMPGLINLDFADIRTVMSEMGKAMMGTGEAEGDRRAVDAAEAAINNPLLARTKNAATPAAGRTDPARPELRAEPRADGPAEPVAAVAEAAETAAVRSGAFIAPKPADAGGARPVPLAQPAVPPSPEARPKSRTPSLIERVTGIGRARSTAPPTPAPRSQPTAAKPAQQQQPRLTPLEADQKPGTNKEDDLLDIPAFLRRQAN